MKLAPALLFAVAAGCTRTGAELPEVRHDSEGVSIEGLGIMTFPSAHQYERGVEQPSARWTGRGWEVRYGLIDKSGPEPVEPMTFIAECKAFDESAGLQRVVLKSLASARYAAGQEGRIYLEALASSKAACEVLTASAGA